MTALALAAALPAAAKEGVRATLTTRVPLDAPAGTRLEVAWKLASRAEDGRRPFGAIGVFVRLRSASGGRAEIGVAPIGSHSNGEYAASVVVPKGGIGDVEIGLHGWADGTPADVLFPITNDPVPGVIRIASTDSAASTTWIVLLVAGSLATPAVLAIALVRRRTFPRS